MDGAAIDSKALSDIVDKFLKGVTKPYEKELFQSTTNEDVLEYINSIQSIRESTRNMINMKRIKPFLTGMEHFEKVLTALEFEHVAKIMACVWGPLRFLLEVTNLTDKEIDNLLDVYEKIGNKLPLLHEYVRLFIAIPETAASLKIYKPTWKALNATTDHLLGALERHQNFIQSSGSRVQNSGAELDLHPDLLTQDGERVKADLSDYLHGVKKYREDYEESEEKRKTKAKRGVLAWISASKKTDSLHKKFQDTRICPDTGRWLFKRYSEVSDWMKEDQPPESAIWLQGTRGFGKTILASLLVDELDELRKKKKYIIPSESRIYYFYCQEEDSEHRTYLDILRGILHQMVDSNDDLLPLCVEKAESSGNPSLADTETAQSLIEAFIEYNTRQYVIIDGLDECDTAEARKAATFFMGQVTKCDNDIKQGHLRLLFMSQPIPELARAKVMPEDDACVQLKATDNAEDIKSYVRKRIEEFSEVRATRSGFNLLESDKDQIESSICRRSEEMFLYAHLAIEYLLQQPTKEKLREKMKEEMAPKELKQIYEKLLGIVKAELLNLTDGEDHWDMAKQLLGWLVCAKRPLKWHEMQSILSYVPDQQKVDFDNKMLRQDASKYLGSLVHVLEGGHIRIVHSTARSYIIQNQYINAQAVYCELAVRCLRYLCLISDSKAYAEDERKEKVKLGWFSFQDYACSQWHSHVSTVIELCGDIFHDPSQNYGIKFGSALQDFMNQHAADLAKERHRDFAIQMPPELTRFSGLFFYDNLCNLWNHIYTHQKGEWEIRNTVGITRIDEALAENRNVLETFTPDMEAYNHDTIEDYYGPNLFKCKRLLCKFFHVGYDKKEEREAHNSRHDRPYQCPLHCNAAPIGFPTRRDKERHVRFYHPDLTDGPSVFEAMRPRNGSRSFKCSLCDREFTRKITQLGHERSHFGERPYKCSTCDRAFARLNDCNRHQRQVHAHRGVR
ncbi:hypothetical protein BBK36DRAFT_1198507 [Trichoderma citrinoviride]|uniref:C2H2-type domain-containing protein n=1 Tax=Trichoderma citrinoviride TaxID=58853 RepID=A0A2T4BBX3_9HYPO|nr:hypothetical protein BBK36DRAFT_1198507 [Trichoderma citrinoviride]PTB66815.1 hypothetical protein BBK36DRAFT_1198507 [Trichoderma citrinoviride]